MQKEAENHILFLGTFPPRECGIATFTQDVSDAVGKASFGYFKPIICAMNDDSVNIYNYPKKVVMQINETKREDYTEAAKRVNSNDSIKLVNIQHEFGIFGGKYGDYLIPFLEMLEKPATLTFHTVLPNPEDDLKRVVQAIAQRVKSIVVMAESGSDILKEEYPD